MNAKRALLAVGAVLACGAAVTMYQQQDTLRIRRDSGPNRAWLDDGQEVGIIKL